MFPRETEDKEIQMRAALPEPTRVREHRSTNQIPVLTFKVYSLTNGFLLRTEANWSY